MNYTQELCMILKVNEKNLHARVIGLRLGDVCGRCGGCGRYSFNYQDGDRCYGCLGSGQVFPAKKRLPELVVKAKAAVTSGALDAYLVNLQARAKSKDAIDKIFKAWHAAFEAPADYNWRNATRYYGCDSDRRRDPSYTKRDDGLAKINHLANAAYERFNKFDRRFQKLRVKNWVGYEMFLTMTLLKLERIGALARRFAEKHPSKSV